jgi:hypothetical protein
MLKFLLSFLATQVIVNLHYSVIPFSFFSKANIFFLFQVAIPPDSNLLSLSLQKAINKPYSYYSNF